MYCSSSKCVFSCDSSDCGEPYIERYRLPERRTGKAKHPNSKGVEMTEVTKARATAAAVGCAIILTTGTGMTNVLNAMIPDIMVGLGNPPLTLFMLGPSVATIMAFLGSMVATKLIEKLTPKWSLLIGTICVTLMLTVFAVADHVWMWIAANAVNGIVMSFGAHAAASGVTAKFLGFPHAIGLRHRFRRLFSHVRCRGVSWCVAFEHRGLPYGHVVPGCQLPGPRRWRQPASDRQDSR